MKERLMAQFALPRGPLGALAGRVMAAKPDNRARAAWAVEVLEPAPTDRVLEVGYGPGLSVAHLARRVTEGRVIGVDPSAVMQRQAVRRNRGAVDAGLVELRVGRAEALDEDLCDLDLILAINTWQFWQPQSTTVAELAGRLGPGGRLAILYMQPPGGTLTGDSAAGRLVHQLADAGLGPLGQEHMDHQPPAVMVVGRQGSGRVDPGVDSGAATARPG